MRFGVLDVTHVTALSPYVLLLQFENGEQRRMDMAPMLAVTPFSRLADTATFMRAKVAHGSVAWPGNIDIAPEMLYDLSEIISKESPNHG
jgi:hypothetical protein